jgi:hypothetical protein
MIKFSHWRKISERIARTAPFVALSGGGKMLSVRFQRMMQRGEASWPVDRTPLHIHDCYLEQLPLRRCLSAWNGKHRVSNLKLHELIHAIDAAAGNQMLEIESMATKNC